MADVEDWAPEPLSAEQLERQRVITQGLDQCDRGHLAGRDRLVAVNVLLARAGQVPADQAEVDAVAYERAVAGESRPAMLARSTSSEEPWEAVDAPPAPPAAIDGRAERARIIETQVHSYWRWWTTSLQRRYPLSALAGAGEHRQAEEDRRQLLDAVNRDLVAAGLPAAGDVDLLATMRRVERVMAPHPPDPEPGRARDGVGRFVRDPRSIARNSR
jgi:hypothetical protein